MKKIILAGLFSFLALGLIIGPASAAEFKSGSNFSLRSSETVNDNLYVAGANLSVDGNISGDLYAAGSNLQVSGTIGKEATVAGGSVNITGEVKGDLKAAGGSLVINAPVGGELLAAGGQLSINSRAVIAKDAYLAAGNIYIDGSIKGKLVIHGGQEVVINGPVGGDVKIYYTEKLTLGPNAVITGALTYDSPEAAVMQAGSQVKGEVKHNTVVKKHQEGRPNILPILGMIWLLKLISGLVTGLILLFLFKERVNKINSYAIENFGWELLRGLVLLIVLPIIGIMLLFTVVGIPFAIILLLVYLLMMILGSLVSGIIVGSLFLGLFKKNKGHEVTWLTVVVGIILIALGGVVPVVGWLFDIVFFLVGFGVMFYLPYKAYRK